MKRAITHLKLNSANQVKLDKLDALANEYMRLTQAYVDHIFTHHLTNVTKYDPIPPIITPLSERWKRCAWQQATGLMRSFFSNGRENRPILSAITIQANPNVVVIEPSETGPFDYWLRISTLDKGQPIRVPITLYKKAHQTLAEGKLCAGVTLNKQKGGHWYATLVVEVKNRKLKAKGTLVGVDLGIKNVLTTSTGQHFGQFSDELKQRVERATAKRRRKQKLNACLKKKEKPPVALHDPKLSDFVRNEIGRAVNRFVETLKPGVTVVLESLNIKGMKFKSRQMNRILSASQIGYAARHVRRKLDLAHHRYASVVSAYSSQECSVCGYVDSRNRPDQATFCCLACGHIEHADSNSGKVLVKRFGDTELFQVGDYREVKAILLRRFYDRFPAARSAAGGLDTSSLYGVVAKAVEGQSVHLRPVFQTI